MRSSSFAILASFFAGAAVAPSFACSSSSSSNESNAFDASEPGAEASPHDEAASPEAGGSSEKEAGSLRDASDAGTPGAGDGSAPTCITEGTGALPPDASDVSYDYNGDAGLPCLSKPFCQVTCSSAQSFLAALLACSPAQGGYFWSEGSAYLRVHGISAGACVYDISIETEGDVVYSRCEAPLPVVPWKGLAYIDDSSGSGPQLADGLQNCVTVAHCDAQLGVCVGDAGPFEAGLPSLTPACPVGSASGC